MSTILAPIGAMKRGRYDDFAAPGAFLGEDI